MPQGADAIVMQEDVTRDGDEIVINTEVTAGEFIRRRGCDLTEGQRILAKGERIRASTIALLASQGVGDLIVGGEVNAAILSTGDELVKPGEKLDPGQIYESNSALLRALLHRCGAAVNLVEHCRDERESLSKAIKRGMKNHILVITGGVSVGEHDLVKDACAILARKSTYGAWRSNRVNHSCSDACSRNPHLNPLGAPPGRDPGTRTRSASKGAVRKQ